MATIHTPILRAQVKESDLKAALMAFDAVTIPVLEADFYLAPEDDLDDLYLDEDWEA